MTITMTIQDVLKVVCEVCNVAEEDLKGKSKRREICDARKIFSFHAYSALSCQRSVGELLNRDHSSIAIQLKKYGELYDVDKNFRNKAIRVNELLNM